MKSQVKKHVKKAKKLTKNHSVNRKGRNKKNNIIDLQERRKQKMQQKEDMLLKKNLTIEERNKIVESYLPM
ncbi:MAG: hypothetical protein OXN83_06290, partial [Oligoflexia bacterium]|nr:hypothetical protein [Oligoflexia bacterium]